MMRLNVSPIMFATKLDIPQSIRSYSFEAKIWYPNYFNKKYLFISLCVSDPMSGIKQYNLGQGRYTGSDVTKESLLIFYSIV